jgi:hypothetical protein
MGKSDAAGQRANANLRRGGGLRKLKRETCLACAAILTPARFRGVD